jgi:lysophospholipase L1-like esterase
MERTRRRLVIVLRALVVAVVSAVVPAVVLAACSSSSSDHAPPSAKAPPIVYVSLGDSYSSGEGAPPYRDDARDPKACQRSDRSWTSLLAKALPRVESYTQVACSSATTAYMTGPWASRHLPAQIPAVPDPRVTLVTVTIGGNDLGFGGIVANCFLLDCSAIPSNGLFTAGLAQLQAHLTDGVYPALRNAYPQARLVQVGYPRLTPAPGQPVKGCRWLSTAEQRAADRLVRLIDDRIHAAARASQAPGGAKVRYVDVTRALDGHELCTAAPWVNPVTFRAQAAAHPTAAGQRALEGAVARALDLH